MERLFTPQFLSKKILLIIFSLMVCLSTYGANRTASVSGNWNATATWGGAAVPVAGDAVFINSGRTVTVTSDAACASLTIYAAGTNNGITISGTNSLTVSDAIIMNTPTTNNRSSTIAVGAGLLNAGSITIAGSATNRNCIVSISSGAINVTDIIFSGTPANAQLTFTSAGTLNIDGDLGSGGTFTRGTSTVNCYGAAQTISPYTFYNLTLSGSGAKTFATTPTINGVLSLEGAASIIVTTGVVTYGATATLQYNKSAAYTATAEEWITPFAATGGVIISNSGAITLNSAKVFNTSVPLTINSGATLNTNNDAVTFGGNFINNGTFIANASAITITGNVAQSIDGFTTTGLVSMTKTGGVATFQDNVNAGGLTMDGNGGTLNLGVGLTHTFTGSWTRTNGTLNGGSSTLNFNLAGTMFSGTGGTFTANTGTVCFNNAAAQTFPALTYNNLTLSGGGIKTVATTPTINGIFSLEGTASITVTTGVVSYGTNATLQYNKPAAYTATSEEWISPFAATGGIIIANSGAITLNSLKTFNTSVPLTINSGATLNTSSSNYAVTFGGNFVNNGGTFIANASAITITGNVAQSIDGFTTTGTVSMTKTGGTATLQEAMSSGALTINGAGGTLNLGTLLNHSATSIIFTNGTLNLGSSTITVSGNVTLTTGTLNLGSGTLNVAGNLSGAGTFTASTGTVNFNGADQSIGAYTFNNLILSGSGIKSALGNITVNAGLTTTLGVTLDMTTYQLLGNVTSILNNGTIKTANTSTTPIPTGETWGGNGTLEFTASADQTIVAGTYNNLITSGSGTKSLADDITINGDLAISTNTILNVVPFIWPYYNITLGGDFINNGTFKDYDDFGLGFYFGTVTFNNTSGDQIISGGTKTVFYDFIISNNGHSVILNNDITINNTLNFITASYLDLNSKTLTMINWANGHIAGLTTTPDRYVLWHAGKFIIEGVAAGETIQFPVGLSKASTDYARVDVTNHDASHTTFQYTSIYNYLNDVGTGSGGTQLTTKAVNLTYNITSASTNADITVYWDVSKELPLFTRTLSQVQHYNGTKWELKGTGGNSVHMGTGTIYSQFATGVTSFSPYTTGNQGDPLPIELTYFKASNSKTGVSLTWETASETNNDYFTLERSFDGETWSDIFTQNGAGTSSVTHKYSYTDGDIVSTVLYYRLKQTDFNGDFTYSKIVSIMPQVKGIEYSVYQNPTSNKEINVLLKTEKAETVVLSLFTPSGLKLSSETIPLDANQKVLFNVGSNLSLLPGPYYVTIFTENNYVSTINVIVQ